MSRTPLNRLTVYNDRRTQEYWYLYPEFSSQNTMEIICQELQKVEQIFPVPGSFQQGRTNVTHNLSINFSLYKSIGWSGCEGSAGDLCILCPDGSVHWPWYHSLSWNWRRGLCHFLLLFRLYIHILRNVVRTIVRGGPGYFHLSMIYLISVHQFRHDCLLILRHS